jgi:hypothetical protein
MRDPHAAVMLRSARKRAQEARDTLRRIPIASAVESVRPRPTMPVGPEQLLRTMPLAKVAAIVTAWEDATRFDEDEPPESVRAATVPAPATYPELAGGMP